MRVKEYVKECDGCVVCSFELLFVRLGFDV